MKRILLTAVRMYQVWLGPLLGGACRYYPSCSHYAVQAIERHGARHGFALAARRVLRCHPFSAGGIDPVPEAEPGDFCAKVATRISRGVNAECGHPEHASTGEGSAFRPEQAGPSPRQESAGFGMTDDRCPARGATQEEFAR